MTPEEFRATPEWGKLSADPAFQGAAPEQQDQWIRKLHDRLKERRSPVAEPPKTMADFGSSGPDFSPGGPDAERLAEAGTRMRVLSRGGVTGVAEVLDTVANFTEAKDATDEAAPTIRAGAAGLRSYAKSLAGDKEVDARPIAHGIGRAVPQAGALVAEMAVMGPAGPVLHSMAERGPEAKSAADHLKNAGRGLAWSAAPVRFGQAVGRPIADPIIRRATQAGVAAGSTYLLSDDPTMTGVNALAGAISPRLAKSYLPARSIDDIMDPIRRRAGMHVSTDRVSPAFSGADEAAAGMGGGPAAAAAEGLPKRAGSIGLAKFDGYNVKGTINETVKQIRADELARTGVPRGTVKPWIETDAAARQMSGDYLEDLSRVLGRSRDEILAGSKAPSALNEEQARALVLMVEESSNKAFSSAQNYGRLKTQGARDAALRDLEIHTQLTDWLDTGSQTGGRAQNILKMHTAGGDEVALRGAAREAARKYGGEASLDQVLQLASGMETAQGAGALFRTFTKLKAAGAPTRDALHLGWMQGLLSGPQTLTMNAASNAAFQFYEGIVERGLAAGVGAARSGVKQAFGRGPVHDRVLFQEIPESLWAWREGFDDALVAAARNFKTGESLISTSSKVGVAQALPRKLTPVTNLLGATDEGFKHAMYGKELRMAGLREAKAKGVPIGQRSEYARSAARSGRLDPKAFKEAKDAADRITYTEKLGKAGRTIGAATRVEGVRYAVPFFSTLANITKQGLQRGPVTGLFSPTNWTELVEGGAKGDKAAAKMIVSGIGTGLLAWLAPKVADGTVVGAAPTNQGELAQFYLEGKVPYSVQMGGEIGEDGKKHGGRYVNFGRLEPVGTPLGLAVSMIEGYQDRENPDPKRLPTLFWRSIRDNLLSKTGFTGLSDVLLAAQDYDQFGEKWERRMASSVVPNVLAQVARSTDTDAEGNPIVRDAQTIGTAIEAKVPEFLTRGTPFEGFGRETLPARRDLAGEMQTYGEPVGGNIFSPLWAKQATNDPVWQEMRDTETFLQNPQRTFDLKAKSLGIGDDDLEKMRADVRSGRLGKEKTRLLRELIEGKSVEMTPEEYEEYTKVTGERAHGVLSQVVKNPKFQDLDRDQRGDLMRKAYTDVHRGYTSQILKPKYARKFLTEIYGGEQ